MVLYTKFNPGPYVYVGHISATNAGDTRFVTFTTSRELTRCERLAARIRRVLMPRPT